MPDDPPGTLGYNDIHVEYGAGGYGRDLMYCAIVRAAGSGILVYDVTDDSNPYRYAWLQLPETCDRLAMDWPVLYATSSTGLYSIDCIPLAAPSQLDYIALCPSISPAPRVALYPADDRAYLNCSNNGLQIVDISDPSNMSELAGGDFDIGATGTFYYPEWNEALLSCRPSQGPHDFFYGIYSCPLTTGATYGYQNCFLWDGGVDIKVDSGSIYLDNGRVVWKIVRSDAPEIADIEWIWACMVTTTSSGLSNSFDMDGGQVYAHQRGCSPNPYDFQMPQASSQTWVDNCSMTKGAASCLAYGKTFYESARDIAYVCRDDGLSVVDCSPASEIKSIELGYGSRSVWADASYIYLAIWDGPSDHRIHIYDITDPYGPDNPNLVGVAD